MHFKFFGLHASQYETAGISLTTWGRTRSLAWNAKLSFPTRGRNHASFLKVHLSPASPQNTTPPFPTNPLSSIGKDSSPFKLQNPYKSCPTKSFLYLDFSHFFLFICISFFFFFFLSFFIISFEFSFCFFQKLEFFPKVEKIIPQHLRWIIEE